MADQLVGNIAVEAIDQIMERKRIPKLSSGITVKSNATFAEVMQYLWYYVGRGAIRPDRLEGHRYRTNFYRDTLRQAQLDSVQIQHIDIGCGGGTFTWALLEWCISEGMDLDKIGLHGYDYAPKMVKAAKLIHRLISKRHSQNVPKLNVRSNYRKMLKSIPTTKSESAQYIITAGYVVANSLREEAVNRNETVEDFTNIIVEVCAKANDNSCALVVCDTLNVDKSNGWATLGPSYDFLVESLETSGVQVDTWGSGPGLRIAELSC